MNPDLEIFLGIACVIVVIVAVVLLVPRSAARPARSIEAKLDGLVRRVDDVEKTAKTAEHDIRNVRMSVAGLATKDSVTTLSVQVAEMRGEVKGVENNTAATTRSIERIESFLMQSGASAIAGNKSADNGVD